MRLGAQTIQYIEDVARGAWSAQKLVRLPAPDLRTAIHIVEASTPHVERHGGERDGLGWRFANGSRIAVTF